MSLEKVCWVVASRWLFYCCFLNCWCHTVIVWGRRVVVYSVSPAWGGFYRCACALSCHLSPACAFTSSLQSPMLGQLLLMYERDLQLLHSFCPACVRCRTAQLPLFVHSSISPITACGTLHPYFKSLKDLQAAECLSAQCVLSDLALHPLEKYRSWSCLWLFPLADRAAYGLVGHVPDCHQDVGTHSAVLQSCFLWVLKDSL